MKIRVNLTVNAKVTHLLGGLCEAFSLYSRASYLCAAGNNFWKICADDCSETCGEVFSIPFIHALHGIIDKFHMSVLGTTLEDLDEHCTPEMLRIRAAGLISEIISDHGLTFFSPSHKLASYSIPLSEAHEHLGDVTIQDSWLKSFKAPQRKLTYADQEDSIAAAKLFQRAAYLLPIDALGHTRSLCAAVMCEIRAGGKTINYILDKFVEIEESRKKLTAWYGPPDESEISDVFIRGVMRVIRKWLNHQSICCCRKSTREIDLRHTIRAWPLTEIKISDKMFDVGKSDARMRRVTFINGGKCFCQNKDCSDNHVSS